jgi:hypothetical protein
MNGADTVRRWRGAARPDGSLRDVLAREAGAGWLVRALLGRGPSRRPGDAASGPPGPTAEDLPGATAGHDGAAVPGETPGPAPRPQAPALN